jgi:hypothetical protein
MLDERQDGLRKTEVGNNEMVEETEGGGDGEEAVLISSCLFS